MKGTLTTLAALLALGACATAGAGPQTADVSGADAVQPRILAIAAGDMAALSAPYADDATMQWVGGPLDGTYTGREKLSELWTKFTRAQGPLAAQIGQVETSANPRGRTLVTNVAFTGKHGTVKVRYATVYRGDRLTAEVWQIDPALRF